MLLTDSLMPSRRLTLSRFFVFLSPGASERGAHSLRDILPLPPALLLLTLLVLSTQPPTGVSPRALSLAPSVLALRPAFELISWL